MTLGRGFTPDEEDYRAPKGVAVISHRFWQERFGANPAVVGRTVRVGRQPIMIVGVAATAFEDPHRSLGAELWMPIPAQALVGGPTFDASRFADPRRDEVRLLGGRLTPGVTRHAAAAELGNLSRHFRDSVSLPHAQIAVIDTRPVTGWPPGSVRRVLPVQALIVLAVVVVLLVACANAGNLLLTRAMSRRRDIAIRLSLGASRARIVRQLLLEAALLSTAAGVLGLGLAFLAPRLMLGLGFGYGADGFGRIATPASVTSSVFAPDAVVYWAALLLVTLTTAAAGLGPALQAARCNISAIAGERHGATSPGGRSRIGLMAVQVALATVLVVGAGVLTRAIAEAATLNPGFAVGDVWTVSVKPDIPPTSMATSGRAFFLALRDALGESDLNPVAFADEPPFWDQNLVMMVRRTDDSSGQVQQVLMRRVSRKYFAVLGIPVVTGHIPEDDTESRELVLNETAARTLWPGVDPIGRNLLSAVSRTEFEHFRVAAIVRDVPVRSMSEIEAVIYRMPEWMPDAGTITVFVRRAAPGAGERVRAVAASLAPRVTVSERPLVDYVRGSLETAVLASRVSWAIGAVALVLAMAGAFGVLAYFVEERRREIGIRMALGARPREAAAPIVRTAARAIGTGVVAGFLLAALAVPLLGRFLYGLNPFDPVAYAGVAGILALAAALATWIPVRRAMAVDPTTLLRSE
jgi:predicted permease